MYYHLDQYNASGEVTGCYTVTREEFIRAERAAGFRGRTQDDVATSSFQNGMISGHQKFLCSHSHRRTFRT